MIAVRRPSTISDWSLLTNQFPVILLDIDKEDRMTNTAQKRALKRYRKRLAKRGMARFEVLGLHADRALIRSLARRLADRSPEVTQIRTTLRRAILDKPPRKGGILSALRRSPLVGADLEVTRSIADDRKAHL